MNPATMDPDTVTTKDKLEMVKESEGLYINILEGAELEELVLLDLPQLRELPKGLRARSIIISDCENLKLIPNETIVGLEVLSITRCHSLKEIPGKVAESVQDTIEISSCPSLKYVLGDKIETKQCSIHSCEKLHVIPEVVKVDGTVTLANNNSLVHLPRVLEAGRDLNIGMCPNVHILPSNLVVEGDLYLEHSGVRVIHNGIFVGGSILIGELK